MSIVRLEKVTLVGSSQDKLGVLEDLQELGCVHLIPLAETRSTSERDGHSRGSEALQFLLSSPRTFKQVTKDPTFDPEKVKKDALALRQRLDALTIEHDHLIQVLAERRPWGDFKPPQENEFGNMRLWLYQVPLFQRKLVETSGLNWQIVKSDNRFDYVAVLSDQEPVPESMPVAPLKPDSRSLSELESRLEEVELAIGEAQIQRESMSRWCLLLARNLDKLDDHAALKHAGTLVRDEDPVFALQGWIPAERLPDLRSFAEKRGMVFEATPPDPSELPPTKFRNPEHIAGGEELVSFYMTPSYWLCDPSPVVFFSFALFFAMIMSDAGYGLLMAIATAAFWKKMGASPLARRWRLILAWVSGLTIVYGVLVGSYFGIEPKSAYLKPLHIIKMTNYSQMMLLTVIIGAAHVILANLMNAWRYGRDLRALAPLGWAIMIVGGLTMALASKFSTPGMNQAGIAGVVIGVLLVVLFTAADQPWGQRLIGGLLGLTKVTSAFGDVLSYLRLFALGLASASLAAVFNGMASGIYHKIAGLGLFLAILVFLVGHAVNFVLSISSGFIHGLRLNVIEFFNWGVQDEGKVYRPLIRKESVTWKH